MSDLPKIHPRHYQVAAATSEVQTHLSGAIERHELTYAEVMVVLATVTQTWAYLLLKADRGES